MMTRHPDDRGIEDVRPQTRNGGGGGGGGDKLLSFRRREEKSLVFLK